MTITFWLAVAGLPLFLGANSVAVELRPLPPEIMAVACDSRMFGHVEGNAQHLCDGVSRGIVLDPEKIDDTPTLRVLLCHEWFHLTHPAIRGDSAWELFREAEAYAAGEKCR